MVGFWMKFRRTPFSYNFGIPKYQHLGVPFFKMLSYCKGVLPAEMVEKSVIVQKMFRLLRKILPSS